MLDNETAEYKNYLESATTRELTKIADQAGIDIPADLDRIFIIRELLDMALDEKVLEESLTDVPGYSAEIGQPENANQNYSMDIPQDFKKSSPVSFGDSHLELKTASLPQQYHITYLDVLPRDPQWVYVFWEIKPQDRERCEIDPRFEGYALNALENNKQGICPEECSDKDFKLAFTVPVGKEDNSWYLGISGSGVFRVSLWVRGLNTSLVVSRPFVLPKFLNSPGNEKYLTQPLIQLSGVSDYPVLRSAERASNSRP
jgi:hypothetical protein